MSKILINNTANNIELDSGITVPASSQITVNPTDFADLSNSDDIYVFIGNEDITVNDGSNDLSIGDAVGLIKSTFINLGGNTLVGEKGDKGDQGDPGVSGFGIYAFSNTQSDGTILKGRGLTINKTGTGTYDYAFTTPTPDTNYIPQVSFFNLGTNTDTNGFINSKTVNGFTVTTGVGDNGTAPDTLTDTNHSVVVLGDAGPQGITSAYESWLDIGNTGTEADFLATLVGPTGPTGATGPQGPPGDSQIRVSPNDSTVGFIEDKFVAGNNQISVTVANDGADEDIVIQFVPSNVGTSELNNNANFIDSAGAPVQPGDIANFETSSQLDIRDTNNRNRANHTGTQLSSTISDFASAAQAAQSVTSLSFNAGTNILSFVDEAGATTNLDLSLFLDDTNLSRISGGVLNSGTGICTFTRDDLTTFDVDFSSLNDQAFINQAIVNLKAETDPFPQYLLIADKAFKDFVRRDDLLISQDGNNTEYTYLTLNTTVPRTGNYRITCNYNWAYDATNTNFQARVILNSDTANALYEHRQEPRDSGGSGIVGGRADGAPTPAINTGTDQSHPATYDDVIALTAGANTIELRWSGQEVGVETSIYRGSIILEEWS